MANTVFDQVIEKGGSVFRNIYGFEIKSCKKRSDTRFDLYDSKGLAMYAEGETRFSGFQAMDFYDAYGHKIGSAGIAGGSTIEYYDRNDRKVGYASVDFSRLSDKKSDSGQDTRSSNSFTGSSRSGGGSENSGGNRDRSESSGGGSVPPGPASELFASIKAIFILLAVLCVAISALFCLLYDYWHIISRVFSFICVFVPVPLMMLIFIRKCHDEGASPERSRFFNTQLFLLAGCFLLVSAAVFFAFYPHYYPFDTDATLFIVISIIPCALHGIASCFSIQPLSQRDRMHCWDIADTAALLACIGNVAFVFLANCTGAFEEFFSTDPTFFDAFLFAMLVCMIALICIVAGLVARIPYWLLRKVL